MAGRHRRDALPINMVEIHRPAIRMSAGEAENTAFYRGLLGLSADPKRPNIKGVPGFWINVGETGQVFLYDPNGNMIELHQVDQCRCRVANRVSDQPPLVPTHRNSAPRHDGVWQPKTRCQRRFHAWPAGLPPRQHLVTRTPWRRSGTYLLRIDAGGGSFRSRAR